MTERKKKRQKKLKIKEQTHTNTYIKQRKDIMFCFHIYLFFFTHGSYPAFSFVDAAERDNRLNSNYSLD